MNSYDAICYICGKPVRGVSGAESVHSNCAKKAEQAEKDTNRYDERPAFAIKK